MVGSIIVWKPLLRGGFGCVEAMHRTLVHGHRPAIHKKRAETLVNAESDLNLSPHDPADQQCDQLSVLAGASSRLLDA